MGSRTWVAPTLVAATTLAATLVLAALLIVAMQRASARLYAEAGVALPPAVSHVAGSVADAGSPSFPAPLGAQPELARTGELPVAYCSEVTASNDPDNPSGRTFTTVAFDDAWFQRSPTAYNHELATTCAVLSAVVNSESQYYNGTDGAAPYAERALGSLGFTDVRTSSYGARSSVLDQVAHLITGANDVSAYTFARKTIAGADGLPETLVFVGVRGSYGAEWLSNLNFLDAAHPLSDSVGASRTEEEVERELEAYLASIGADAARTHVLACGHSRGGAIANLLAARLIDRAGTPRELAPASAVFAYTFAAPSTTRSPERSDARYNGIFNVENQSDLVPQLPLSIWGYGHYGTAVSLPAADEEGFAAEADRMRGALAENTGVDDAGAVSSSELSELSRFAERIARVLPRVESLASPWGIAQTVGMVATLDFGAAADAHYPDTYIAWLQTTSAQELGFAS